MEYFDEEINKMKMQYNKHLHKPFKRSGCKRILYNTIVKGKYALIFAE